MIDTSKWSTPELRAIAEQIAKELELRARGARTMGTLLGMPVITEPGMPDDAVRVGRQMYRVSTDEKGAISFSMINVHDIHEREGNTDGKERAG